VSPQELFATKSPDIVRVTRADSTTLTLAQPRLTGDTLRGERRDSSVALPLDDVARLEVRATDTGSTVVLIGVIVGAIAGFFAIANNAAGGPSS